MNYENYFKDLFQSIPDYGKRVLLMILIKNDENLLKEFGYLKSDINRLNSELKNVLLEQKENYLDFIKNEEESVIEKILKK